MKKILVAARITEKARDLLNEAKSLGVSKEVIIDQAIKKHARTIIRKMAP